jgi:predicted dehydrogenase
MNTPHQTSLSRRHFFHGTAVAAAPLLFPYVLKGATGADAKNSETLKIGLVGCGGRGSGAAQQALSADYNTTLHAVADVDADKAAASLKLLVDQFADRAEVPEERRFMGLDAYEKLIACCDVVILASPPGFRPLHLTAAVEAGKHIFAEKPMAVDAAGYRVAMEAIRKSQEKKLCVVAGYCWRRSASRQEAFKRLHDGQIGDVASIFSTYYTGPVKPMPELATRKPEMSDVEWQIRNWYNFSWLSGDSLVEQAIHSVDKICWAMKDVDPVSCVATGGRQIPNEGGNIYDHFHVAYEFPGQVLCHLGSRQMKGCYNENGDNIRGTKGSLIIGRGPQPMIEADERWRFRGEEKNMYQVEHDDLFAAIRKGEVVNDGTWMLHSTMVGIMGRMAAYTGKKITWADAINSPDDLAPEETLKWGDKFEATPMPRPGQMA